MKAAICTCQHAKTHHPVKAGGTCKGDTVLTWKGVPCVCTKTREVVADEVAARRQKRREELAAKRARELTYREAAVRLYTSDALQVDGVNLARVQDGDGGAWVTAKVWVPASEIEGIA